MLNMQMVKRDVKSLFAKTNAILIKDDLKLNCHFNKYTKVIFDDGAVATQTTALISDNDGIKLRVKDEVMINEQGYVITKIELENQVTKRLYLKEA